MLANIHYLLGTMSHWGNFKEIARHFHIVLRKPVKFTDVNHCPLLRLVSIFSKISDSARFENDTSWRRTDEVYKFMLVMYSSI